MGSKLARSACQAPVHGAFLGKSMLIAGKGHGGLSWLKVTVQNTDYICLYKNVQLEKNLLDSKFLKTFFRATYSKCNRSAEYTGSLAVLGGSQHINRTSIRGTERTKETS